MKYAVIGDLHFAHNRTPTRHIIANLKKWINGVTNVVKVIFLTGDVFDKLITYPSEDARLVTEFIRWFVTRCHRNNIVLRILEGTGSHDWRQSYMFETVRTDTDVKWVDTVSVEHIPVLDMHVLYVPDEANRWCRETLDQVRALLVKHKLKRFDIAMMHGVFHYQLSLLPDTHDQSAYEDIVKYSIYIGHIHTSICSGKIHPPGSFERLAHNEEEDKGAWLCDYTNGKVNNEFIVNTDAYPHVTVNVENMSLSDGIAKVKSSISGLSYGRVRVKAEAANPILANMMVLRGQHSHLVIEPFRIAPSYDKVELVEYVVAPISHTNLKESLVDYMKQTQTYDREIVARLNKYL